MRFLRKLELKYGHKAIPDLHKYLIFVSMVGVVISLFDTELDLMSYLYFDIDLILSGQVWRIVTWLMCYKGGVLSLIFLLFLIPMGRHLELIIGTFRMNIYLIGGILLNLIGGVAVYLFTGYAIGQSYSMYLSSYYILLTIFMALAILNPNGQVSLYGILPLKMKWLLIVYLLMLISEVYAYFRYHWIYGLLYGGEIILALVNLFVFFGFFRMKFSLKQQKRQREFKRKMGEATYKAKTTTRHRCAVCGRTEEDDPNLEFRFCSKCTGGKEYCSEHLFTHTHE